MKFVSILSLVGLLSVASAFTPSTTRGVVTRSRVIQEACRTNAKKEKRVRNKENMRKFRKPKSAGKSKATAMGAKRLAAKEAENNFVSQLFSFVAEEE
jgi:hypothetical protein